MPEQVHLAVDSLKTCPDVEKLGRAHHNGCSRQGTGLPALMLLKPKSSSVLPSKEAQRSNRLMLA